MGKCVHQKQGVVLICELQRHDGEKMQNIVSHHFSDSFKKNVSQRVKQLLQDGCPRQNSHVAMRAMRLLSKFNYMKFLYVPRA